VDRNTKIVVVGAGSAEFGLDSLAGILRTEGLHGSELALVDIDADKLRIVEKLAHRMNEAWGAEMRISATTERKEVLGDAGFVILSVAVDREDSWKRDYELALKYGITHYAENGGPGAFAHASRNLGLILPILEDIEVLCPDAYMLTFTNPLTRISTAVHKLSSIRNVGICHGIGIGYFIVATALHEELGIELNPDPRFLWQDDHIEFFAEYQVIAQERYTIKAAGINHFTWILSVREKDTGREIYPHLKEKMAELPEVFEPLTQKMFQIYGLVPVTSDTHISEYVPFASDLREGTWERFDIQLYDFEWAKNRRQATLKFIHDLAEGRESVDPLKEAMSERAEFIIDAMVNNTHAYEEAVNIPNRGYIPNLPEGAIVEVPGVIDADGVSGVYVGALPEPIAALCRTQLTIDELNVEAFVTGDRRLVYQMFSIDPMIQDPDVAIRLADETIEANRDYLPAFE
jgi:alpha-galactosidase